MIKDIFITLQFLFRTLRKLLKSRYRWLLILLMIWLFRVDFITADTGGARIVQILSVFCMFGLILLYKHKIINYSFNDTGATTKSLLVLYLFALLSTLWSYMPSFSFFMAIQNLVFIMGLVWLFSRFTTFQEMENALVLLMVGTMLFEAIGLRLTWQPSLFTHHLATGSVAAMTVSYCTGELLSMKYKDKQRKSLLKGSLVLALFWVVTSTSSGANASAVFGVAVACLLSDKKILFLIACLVSLFLYINQDYAEELFLFVMNKPKEAIESKTGRDVMWKAIIEASQARPILGWGHACIERVISVKLNWTIIDAHNSYYGIYGSLGIVGCVLLGVTLLQGFVRSFVHRMQLGYTGLISALACGALNGYTFGFLSGKTTSITYVFFALLILVHFYSLVQPSDEQSA